MDEGRLPPRNIYRGLHTVDAHDVWRSAADSMQGFIIERGGGVVVLAILGGRSSREKGLYFLKWSLPSYSTYRA